MNTFSAFLSKTEEIAKQVAERATNLAEKAKNEEWVKQVASTVNEAVVTFKTEYNHAMNIASPVIREVGNRFISIDFPSERIIESLGKTLRERYSDDILIINMSEREYQEDLLPGHVISANFRGLPAPPLEMLSRLCLQIHQWLSRSPSNVVAVHCFPGLSRSAVLICCYLAWSGVVQHPVDALVDVFAGLKVDLESSPILPSQKRYLNYFFEFLICNISQLPSEPEKPLFLSKLILSGVPNLPLALDGDFRPFFEIWIDGRMLQSSLPNFVVGETAVENFVQQVPSYPIRKDDVRVSEESACVAVFESSQEIPLKGDLLFRIRHLTKTGARLTCLRFAVNSRHITNGILHLGNQELDGNGFSSCMIDAVFRSVSEPLSDDLDEFNKSSDLVKRSKEISTKLRSGAFSLEIPTSQDLDEVLLMNALGEKSDSKPNHNGIEPQIMGATSLDDDVDDFFAQLEKEAQI